MEDVGAWLQPLRALSLRRMTLTTTLASDVALQDPLCSVVRGLAAASVRAQRCLTGTPACDGCAEAARCDYASLIGTREADGDLARPWWLDGVPGATAAAKGQRWRVALTTVDRGAPRTAALAAGLASALERVGVAGAARHGVAEGIAGPYAWPALDGAALRLATVSPWLVRLEGDDGMARSEARCPEAPWLALLAGAIVRRCDALARAYGDGPLGPLRLPDLRGVRCVEGGWAPWRGSRFSHAQQRRMPLAGFAGEAVLEGDGVAAVAPLLAVGAAVGAGRLRALGFGSLAVSVVG